MKFKARLQGKARPVLTPQPCFHSLDSASQPWQTCIVASRSRELQKQSKPSPIVSWYASFAEFSNFLGSCVLLKILNSWDRYSILKSRHQDFRGICVHVKYDPTDSVRIFRHVIVLQWSLCGQGTLVEHDQSEPHAMLSRHRPHRSACRSALDLRSHLDSS